MISPVVGLPSVVYVSTKRDTVQRPIVPEFCTKRRMPDPLFTYAVNDGSATMSFTTPRTTVTLSVLPATISNNNRVLGHDALAIRLGVSVDLADGQIPINVRHPALLLLMRSESWLMVRSYLARFVLAGPC